MSRALLLVCGVSLLLLLAALPCARGQGACYAKQGACLNIHSETCDATINHWLTGLCPGDASIRCCAPDPAKTKKCLNAGGVCINTDIDSCSGTLKSGLCPSGNNYRCCVTGSTGSKCSKLGGTCIDTDIAGCPGTLMSGYCPGPANIRCCL